MDDCVFKRKGMVSETSCTSTQPLVYVVVLTWNQLETTLECLTSLAQMIYPNFRIVVVDNCSTDGTTGAIKEQFPNVEVVVNKRNLGYPGGCNVGLRYALNQGAEYIFAINNDVSVDPAVLDELLGAAAPDVGILTPKVYFADDPKRIWSVGGRRHPLTLEMIHKCDCRLDQGQWEEVLEQDYLIGCAHLFSRSLLEGIGVLDAGFFLYYDDLDICIRAQRAGYRLLMVPRAYMWHKVAASSGGVGTPRERYYMARSSVRFLRKHARVWQWLFVIPYRTGSAIKTVLRLAWRRRWDSVKAYLQGLRDGLWISTAYREVPPCES
jgi:GT2 family glycosyltransferase